MAAKSAETRTEAEAHDAATTAPALVSEALSGPVTPTTVANLAVDMIGMNTHLAGDDEPVKASEADVVNELAAGGPAFGSFLKAVGVAVAETQAALDKTLAETAKSLAKETVKIPAAFVQELNDQGEVEPVTSEDDGTMPGVIMQEFPLLAFVPLTGYGVRQVHLTADMEVSEFNTANGLNIKKSHTDFGLKAKASYGLLGGFNASGNTALNTNSDNDSERRSTSEDKAAGKLHMEATIEPRHDIQIPRPFIIQRGPKIQLSALKRDEVTGDAKAPDVITRREVTIGVKVLSKDNAPITGAALDFTCDAGFFCQVGAVDDKGFLPVTVVRDGLTRENNAPLSTVFRARLKLVSAELPISI